MATRMIKVRSKINGQTTLVSEKAYGLFAAYYERLDQPAPEPTSVEPTAPAVPSRPVRTPRPATTTDKEQ